MSGFPALGADLTKLFEWLVVGVEQVNMRLEWIEEVLWEGAVDKFREVQDQDLKMQWCRMWEVGEMDKELKEIEEEKTGVSPVEGRGVRSWK